MNLYLWFMTRILQSPLVEGFRWTVKRYHHAIERGLLTEEDRVELLQGDLIDIMPVGELHSDTVERLAEYFFQRFGTKYRLRSENPVILSETSQPQPDFAIARKRKEGRRGGHPVPGEIILLIEVADNSLEKDRKIKAPLYAAAGIPEYWIINIRDGQVEVYLQPEADDTYTSIELYAVGDHLVSPAVGRLAVSDLLPHP